MNLTKEDLDTLRRALENKRAELLRAVEQNVTTATHSEEDNYPDPMDAATRAEQEHETLELASRDRALVAEIDRALGKFDKGTYGISELSGEPIPIERLRVLPWARRSAEEEERRRQ